MAEENEYDSEPNDEGDIEKRPGKLSDYLPKPFPVEKLLTCLRDVLKGQVRGS